MSYGYRSRIERDTLKVEAERRVRAGESRADVARSLRLSLGTLAQWASNDGWRRKDIEAEAPAELAEAAARRIADGLARDAARLMAEEDARRRAAESHAALIAAEKARIDAHQNQVVGNLERLFARLERHQREQAEAEAAPDAPKAES